MIEINISSIGLKELSARFHQAPDKFKNAMKTTMQASLLHIWGKDPPYPAPPQDSKYVRTETLGRSLGSGFQGGKSSSRPDIYEVKEMGGNFVGSFGTRVKYAPYVIGERQARWNSHWWTIEKLAKSAEAGILNLFQVMAEELAKWLERG